MTTETQDTDRLANAKAQGQAQFDSIVEMVKALRDQEGASETDAYEDAEQAIHEDALSVEVRSGWYMPRHSSAIGDSDSNPAEYRILLCTGGPAVQIRGTLSEHGEPETAHLEVQDWFTPWTEYCPVYKNSHTVGAEGWLEDANAREEILLTYARCFWFGE
jgi:hypothetical protein